jgi:predicted enzyme related to lactoylglutathione lyase
MWHDRLMLQLLGFIIDCPDPMKLATFYSQVTGHAIMEGNSGDLAGITLGEVDLTFQRVENYRPPRWPDDEHPKQYHLDFEVNDIEAEQSRVVKLGATLQKDLIGPEGYGWRVYTDPAGHPFCLCRHEGAASRTAARSRCLPLTGASRTARTCSRRPSSGCSGGGGRYAGTPRGT